MLRWRGDFGDFEGAWFPANFCEEINVMIEPEQQYGEVRSYMDDSSFGLNFDLGKIARTISAVEAISEPIYWISIIISFAVF